MNNYKAKERDHLIQILRIIAAGGVLLVHYGYSFNIVGNARSILNLGAYGLYIFFVLSGYLACYSNLSSPKKFIKSKIVRLVPVYYLMLAIYGILHTTVLRDIPKDELGLRWFRYIFAINSILPADDIFWKSIHAIWYVSVVWCFYLLFLFLWPKMKKLNIYIWILTFYLLCLCAVMIEKTDPLARVNFFAFLQYFILGIIAYKSENDKKILFLIPCSLIGASLTTINPWLFNNLFMASLIMILIAFYKNKWNKYKSDYTERILTEIDNCTYSLYLVHPLLGDIVMPLLRMKNWPEVYMKILFWIVLFVGVFLVHYFYEYNMKKILAKILP